MQSQNSPRLIANTLPRQTGRAAPVMRTLDHAAPQPKMSRPDDAPRNEYRITDRALDCVVDRLLEELTW